MNIGFIGLGSMGAGMARRLIDAGHRLTVYNRTRSRAEPFQALGASWQIVSTTPLGVPRRSSHWWATIARS